MSPDISRRTVLLAIVALVAVVGVASAGVAMTYDSPQVENASTTFGTVNAEYAQVHTRVVVTNPNGQSYPGSHDLGYTVLLNDVTVVNGEKPGVQLQPGRNVVETTARFDNAKIPAWWASHVNNDERTRFRTRAEVGLFGLPVGPGIPVQSRTITTDLLGPLTNESRSTVTLGSREVLVIGDQRGSWAEADAQRSPIAFSSEMKNVHERPVHIDGVDYEIRMNDVVVGAGRTNDSIELQPGESGTFTANIGLDTQKMQQWWVSHLRNNQSTDLSVEIYAVVDDGDERERVPLTVFERHAVFETDFLGSGATSVRVVGTGTTPAFSQPSVEEAGSEWGRVGDDETAIRTTVDVVNNNSEAFNDILSLDVTQRTTFAGVMVTEGTRTIEDLPQGSGEVAVRTTMAHSVVPEWWAAHLRNGETSQSRTELDGVADVGVTTFGLDLEDRNSTVETNTLSDLNDDSTRAVRSDETGRRLLTVHSTTAEWRDVSAESATIHVTADLENENQLESATIKEIDYAVDINNVSLADDRAPQEYTLDPGERRTVTLTLELNNSKMAEWWPTHIRRGEQSEIHRKVVATVETDGEEERVKLEFLSGTVPVETDLLSD